MSKQQSKTKTNSFSSLDKKLSLGNTTSKATEKKLNPNKKIPKNFKLGEDVVDFLDRVSFHQQINRTVFIEQLIRKEALKLNLPPVPENANFKDLEKQKADDLLNR